MQDNFVGDLGDFGKYGLLRVLTGLCSEQPRIDRLSLGVVWYVPDDETVARTKPGHGQRVGYLFDQRTREDWRSCDKTLFSDLRNLVCGERSLRAVGRRGIIGPDEAFHCQPIRLPASLVEREVERRTWLEHALQFVRGRDLVFLDPDVGLADPATGKAPRKLSLRSQDAPKYVFMWELDEFLRQESSVIVYQSFPRADPSDSIREWREILCTRYPRRVLPNIVTFQSRAFVILATADHAAIIDRRLRELTGRGSPWGNRFRLHCCE